MSSDRKAFSKRLLKWWRKNQREFPWRTTQKAYPVLMSEILLHRTKADQVSPIYSQFIKEFPTIEDLSNASINDVRKILHSLGLHWRTELLYQMAKELVKKHGGKIPSEWEELVSLPGVSHYIASAVRCFSFGYPDALLDTNTIRVLGRFFGIEITDSSRRSQHFKELYLSLINMEQPRKFGYAMIDLGALLCKPKRPMCGLCLLNDICKHGISIASSG